MKKQIEEIKKIVAEFPTGPGVYLMKNKIDKIIYVGKAKNLRSRVKSYFQDSKDLSPKTRLLVSHIERVEFVLTNNEIEAFLLEASLIKKHRPKYNIRLKDDKTYPYIRVSMGDDFPRIYIARKVKKDKSLYFGPFTNSKAVWETIHFLNHTFQIRDCSDQFMKNRQRPCITYEIGYCTAPCVGFIDREGYAKNIRNAIDFLKGKNRGIIKDLKSKMSFYSKDEKFEQAAKIRDSIQLIEQVLEKQTVINDKLEIDQDVLHYFGDERGVAVEILSLRHGRVLGSRTQFLPQMSLLAFEEDIQESFSSIINQYYEENFIPDELILPLDLGDSLKLVLEKVLKGRCEKKVKVLSSKDKTSEKLIRMALSNAKEHFKNFIKGQESKINGLLEIQQKFRLKDIPIKIECFDISHFQGAQTVASQVVFENGVSNKNLYRRYKLKALFGNNDYESMREVLERRFQHEDIEDPQLVLIDGGKGQLNIAIQVLKDLNKEIPLASLAEAKVKRDFKGEDVIASQERFFLPGQSNYITFKNNSEAFKILVGIRDEAHRFAVSYHRNLREKSALRSLLDAIPGVGPKKKETLLKSFNSLEDIKNSTIEMLSSLEGFNKKLSEEILSYLQEHMESKPEEASDLE